MNIAFAGTPEFAATILQGLLNHNYRPCLVLTQPDRPSGRGRKLVPSPVKKLALAEDLPLQQPGSLRPSKETGRQGLSALKGVQMDLLIVAAYGLILPPEVLQHPTHGAWNVHASILPRWRGAAPIERAIMAGDETSGATLMQMDEGLDTGDTIAFAHCDISGNRTAEEATHEIADLGVSLLVKALPNIADLPRTSQNDALATYATKLTTEDALIDWHASAATIHNQVRALSGRMSAYTWIGTADEQIRVKLLSTSVAEQSGAASAGEILPAGKGQIVVACGSGALSIESLQINTGKGKVMDAAAALNGYASLLAPGNAFGLAGPTL